jgi:nitrous oxidase accessory protein NosD
MKGDFTRSTFDPVKRYSSVRMQQGRVQLDADWNEQVEIGDRLREQGFSDIIGRCGAPKDEHGGGFKVELAAGGDDLSVTPGRIWVDGILCEAQAPDGANVLELTEQVDFPGYETPSDDGRYLIYLDVWQQHVTALEDTDIQETALGGPDTATRTRTVAQVKWVRVPDSSECGDELSAWDEVTTVPTGRMRARTRPGDSGGPCVVPESAGYTRLENQLYRVEVHRGGQLGGGGPQPTFKWSRENGSVVTRWLSTNGQQVTLESLGRDRILGFTDARWVELGDDRDELNGEHGQLREITAVGDDTLTLDANPGAPGPADRHPKVRRWEMTGAAGAIPIVTAPNDNDDSWTPLESGIQVDFAAGTYRTGDWWWIPARAFIGEFAGEIEWPAAGGGPVALSPEGIRHHYCRLALVDMVGGEWVEPVEDCRHIFCPLTELEPGESCCTVVVHPGTDLIQAAIDSLPAAGGCVCLKAGVHEITDTVIINRGNVTLHGESAGAVVHTTQALPMLRTGSPGPYLQGLEIAGIDFLFEASPADADSLPTLPLVDLESTEGASFTGCRVAVSEPSTAVGVRIGRGIDLRIEDCRIGNTVYGIWLDTDSTDIAVRRCQVVMGGQNQQIQGWIALLLEDAYGPCWIEDNYIDGYWMAIRLDGAQIGEVPRRSGSGSVVAGNRIRRRFQLGGVDSKLFAIVVAGNDSVVRDNVIGCPSPSHGGILMTGNRGRIENNSLVGPRESDEQTFALGILVGYPAEAPGDYGDQARVQGNRLEGAFDGIWVHGSTGSVIEGNHVGARSQPARVGIALTAAERTVAAGNQMDRCDWGVVLFAGRRNRLEHNHLHSGFAGLTAVDEDNLTATGNRVEDFAGPGLMAFAASGISTLHGNRFASCAQQPGPLAAVSVAILSDDLASHVRLQDCEIIDTGVSLEGEPMVAQPAWGAFFLATACTVQDCNVSYTDPLQLGLANDHRALVLVGPPFYVTGEILLEFGRATVSGNTFLGPAPQELVSVVRLPLTNNFGLGFNRVIFSDNHCQHLASPEVNPTNGLSVSRTVGMGASRSTVQGNQVESFPTASSFDFQNTGRTVFLGNFIRGPVIRWTPFPNNFQNFNQSG